jgi:POT family proton-dependent oligopeptide transporter
MALTRLKFNPVYLIQPLFNSCFYSIKGVFIFYVISHLSLSESQAMSVYATFMTLCYATTLAGGYIGDRWLGVRNASIVGGILTVAGLAFVLLPSMDLCFFGLALASLGSGLFKPNLLSAVGLIFENPEDHQKDRAYSNTFVLWNIGGFLLPLLCALIGDYFGWLYSILLVIGLFALGTYLVYKIMRLHPTHEAKQPHAVPHHKLWTFIVSSMPLLYFLFAYQESFHWMMGTITCGSFIYLGKVLYECTPQERKGLLSALAYALLFALFASLFEQAGSSYTLFLKNAVDRDVMGFTIPAPAFMPMQAFFIFTLGPILNLITFRYLERGGPLAGFTKPGFGFLIAALSFWILVFGTYQGVPIPIIWILGALVLQTIGDLWIVPISLSKISQNSLPRLQSITMSFWTMAIAYGHYFAGIMAQFSIAAPEEDSLGQYRAFFFWLGCMALVIGITTLLCEWARRKRLLGARLPLPEKQI